MRSRCSVATGVRRAAFAGLALGAALLATGAGTVFAADAPDVTGGPSLDAAGVTEGPASDTGQGPAHPAGGDEPRQNVADAGMAGARDAASDASDPAAGAALPGGAAGTAGASSAGAAPSDISVTGEAYLVGHDFEAPVDVLVGRYPRASAEVTSTASRALGAFADPGVAGEVTADRGAEAGAGDDVAAPAWAECVHPETPATPSEDARSPGQGATLTAVARCYQGAAQAAGYYARDPGPRATGGVALLEAAGVAATVEATSNAAGATLTTVMSTAEQIRIAGVVTIDALTNAVTVRTNGQPGGAAAETAATLAGLTIAGVPVQLPSDSLEQLDATLADLPPVVSPLGVITFDVVGEQHDAATDGTSAAGRAAQLLVTIHNGQSTVSFGVGHASAQGRTTILGDHAGRPVASGARPPLPPYRSFVGQPLRPATGRAGFSASAPRSPALRGRAPRGASLPRLVGPGFAAPPRPGGAAAPGGIPSAGLNVLPPPAPPAQTAGGPVPYGGSGPWIALIGGSVIALGLARYLAYSTALRPSAA